MPPGSRFQGLRSPALRSPDAENQQAEYGQDFAPQGSKPVLSLVRLEILTHCDSPMDYGGKVCVSAAVDSVAAAEAP